MKLVIQRGRRYIECGEQKMGFSEVSCRDVLLCLFIVVCLVFQSIAIEVGPEIPEHTATLVVDASDASGRPMPETFLGIFFEEINHAGTGGLWAELVSNRGFEAGRINTSSTIYPWSIIGDESSIHVATDRSSCFDHNKVALQMEVLCDNEGDSICPAGGVGIYNPGFWGMNIEQGKTYNVIFYVRSTASIDLMVSFTGSDGEGELASTYIRALASDVSNWTKVETQLEAKATNHNARLQLTTTKKGVIWLDQVSAMPLDTYKGHGFRSDLVEMLADLKPRFIRFPGGNFVEGRLLRNAFRWKETVGPWEDRPGHFNDAWNYWTDDGLGYFEFHQLAEDLDALPIWVFNNGFSINEQVDTSNISTFVQEALDGIEFAIGDPTSKWGSIRADMGHKEPFDLRYVAVGNENCGNYENYAGNYLKFYTAIRSSYPDIQIISNCDFSVKPLDQPADLYDYHLYSPAADMFSKAHAFDHAPRDGPKAFVSEYAVIGKDAGNGSLLAALAEAAFLMGLERNSDVVKLVSYAPLFVNANDRTWNPDAIVFNSYQSYGTPSYWVQQFFIESSGATLHNTTLQTTESDSLVASAISWQNSADQKNYLRIKIVNYGSCTVNLNISVDGLDPNSVQLCGSTTTLLTSADVMDENSFSQPEKVVPIQSPLEHGGYDMNFLLLPHSFTSFDLLKTVN